MSGHIWTSWHNLALWLDSSNWAGMVEALIIPTVPITLYTRLMHRRTRQSVDASLAEHRDKIQQMHEDLIVRIRKEQPHVGQAVPAGPADAGPPDGAGDREDRQEGHR